MIVKESTVLFCIVFQCGLPALVSRWFRCHENSLSFAVFDGIYGFFTAASEALSCIIVDDILGTSSLSDG